MTKIFLVIALAVCLVGMLRLLWVQATADSERVCRHAMQRNFGVEKTAAERLIREQREREH